MPNDALESYYGQILGQLEDFEWLPGGNGLARCPAHAPDRHRSLSVKFGRNSELLLCCHADKGCSFPAIVEALRREQKEFFVNETQQQAPKGERITHHFDYVDEGGEVVYQSIRCEPKRFFQRRADGAGGWVNNLDGVERIPYRLPELMEAPVDRMVFVVEGELKVEAIERLGLVATCNAGGSEKWPLHFARYMQGRAVAILPDNDEKGWRHAYHVGRCLTGVCAPIRVVELPGLRVRDDVVDWLQLLGKDPVYARDHLCKLVLRTMPWDGTSDAEGRLAALRLALARALATSGAI